MSASDDYALVICMGGHGDALCIPACGPVLLSEQEYMRQMTRADDRWCCPRCGGLAEFDDAYFEKRHDIE